MFLSVPQYAIPDYSLPEYAMPSTESVGDAPAAPSDLTATAVSSSQIDLAWTDNSADVDGVNEVQTITTAGTLISGSMMLVFDEETTAAIAYNDTAEDVQTKLRALASITGTQVTVTGDLNELVVEFTGGLGAMDVPQITVASGPGDYTIAKACVPTLTVVHAGDEENPQVIQISYAEAPSAGYVVLSKEGGSTADVAWDQTGNQWSTAFNDLTSGGSYTGTGDAGGTMTITATANGAGPTWSVASKPEDPIRKAASTAVATDTEGSPRAWAELGFLVERSPDGSTWGELVDLGANLVSWPDEGLSAATQYYYRVNAYNAAGSSEWSNVADDVTFADSGGTYNNAISRRVGIGWHAIENTSINVGAR